MKRKLAIIMLIVVTANTLGGCGTTTNVKSVPLVPALSRKEVVDYYKEAMSYDTIATRTTKKNEVTYEMIDVTDSNIQNVIIDHTNQIENLLAFDNVIITDGIDPNIHQYIKYVLDDKKLVRDGITSVREALGHYFVDVEYSIVPQDVGAFTDGTKYIGINGAYTEDLLTGEIKVDEQFINLANTQVNDWLAENPLYQRNVSQVEGVRSHLTDVKLFNKVVGMSKGITASMPELNTMYKYPAASLGGYCLFPQGAFTLRDFGYSRSAATGKATLRYVFKKDVLNPEVIEFKNVYMTGYTLDSAPEVDESAVVPEFVIEEAKKIVERSDRAIVNNDVTALVNGGIYDDIGVGVLYGNANKSIYHRKHMSKVSRVVGRTDHKYLVEIETLVNEGPKGTDITGKYVYNGYAVIQQEGTEFHITDYVFTSMRMEKEPQIDTDNTILKRLSALNLAGEVTQEAKNGIVQLMNNLYVASTERQLSAMYDCFNTDVNLLSSTHREYLNSQLRGWLTKLGVNTPATYKGVVSQWIGGAENQVELFTTEIIEYGDTGKGLYMQNYYLVSSYNDKWVIDEMKVIESKDVSGDELRSIVQTIDSGASAAVENPDNNEVLE